MPRKWFGSEKDAFNYARWLRTKHPDYYIEVRFSFENRFNTLSNYYVFWTKN